MSAFGIGRQPPLGLARAGNSNPSEFAGRVVRWIPGDSLVLYAASITWLGSAKPSMALLIVFALVTPLLVLLGAWSRGLVRRSDIVMAGLSVGAFLLWSLSMPGSGWQGWAWIASHEGWVVVISTLGSVVFALFASGVELRLEASRSDLEDNFCDRPLLPEATTELPQSDATPSEADS